MLKKINLSALLALGCIFTGSGLYATATRSAGMGIDQANSWAVEGQLPYLYTNPAEISYFGPMIYGETSGTATTSNGGIIIQPISVLNLGIFAGQAVSSEIGEVYGNYNPGTDITTAVVPAASAILSTLPGFPGTGVSSIFTGPTTVGNTLTNQNASIIAQFNLGTIALGAGFSYGGTSNTFTTDNIEPTPATSEKLTLSDSSIKAVVGAILDFDKVKIDASVAYRSADVNNVYTLDDTTNSTNTTVSYKSDGAGDILIDAQAIFELGNNLLHVMAGFDILNGSSVSASSVTTAAGTRTTEDKYDNTGTDIKVGISDEIRISKDVFAFVGAGFSALTRQSNTPNWTAVTETGTTTTRTDNTDPNTLTKTTTLTLPVFMGMEANLNENWQARFGLGANLLGIADTTSTFTRTKTTAASNGSGTSTWNNATPTFATGLSVKIANFTADWNINIPLLTKGPFFLGGLVPTDGLNTGLAMSFAASYKFGSENTEAKK